MPTVGSLVVLCDVFQACTSSQYYLTYLLFSVLMQPCSLISGVLDCGPALEFLPQLWTLNWAVRGELPLLGVEGNVLQVHIRAGAL